MPDPKPNVFEGQQITADEFLKTHWQRLPYLFKNSVVDMDCLPDAKTLFELAAQEDVQSRIVFTEDQQRFQAIYDDPEAWPEVQHLNPTLLVSDIEKWYPEAIKIMAHFPFIKNWRFDDLMMSYAPTGSSVGAHTDHYDVFLVQVQGTRTWSYDKQPLAHSQMVEDSELAVIDQYQAQMTHELHPGDILYLPPEIPHHGISTSDDCLTCSIGLRAPAHSELLSAVAELLSQNSDPKDRFTDAVKSTIQNNSIGVHEVQYLRRMFTELSQSDDQQLADLFGQYITGYRLFDDIPNEPFRDDQSCKKSPFAIFTYFQITPTEAKLYVNGEVFVTNLKLAQTLCDDFEFKIADLNKLTINPLADRRVIQKLIHMQALIN
ncbi:MAG: cupin domain-containing protein [Marinicella sp.]